MKGIRFYLEFDSARAKRRGEHSGNCLAVLAANGTNGAGDYDAILAPYSRPNCSPCSGGVSREYLRLQCKRISEARAREVHPALFTMVDG